MAVFCFLGAFPPCGADPLFFWEKLRGKDLRGFFAGSWDSLA